jgi:hypothetical protein
MTPAVMPEPAIDDENPLEFVLRVFDVSQLVALAIRVRELERCPGFGEVTITINNGHPRYLRVVESVDFSPKGLREVMPFEKGK